MQSSVELVVAVGLLTTGLSHWLQPRAWGDLFTRWAMLGKSGALMNGMLHAAVGGSVVAVHPSLRGGSALLSVWALLVFAKGLFYLVAPGLGLRQMQRMTPDRAHALRWIGFPMMALGAAIGAVALVSQ